MENIKEKTKELENKIHEMIWSFENENDCGILLSPSNFGKGEEPRRFKLQCSLPSKYNIANIRK